MNWIYAAFILGTSLQLEVAPVDVTAGESAETSVAVFDLQVDTDGRVEESDLLSGQPPLTEGSRLTFDKWEFAALSLNAAHVTATFLVKPKLDFTAPASVLDVALPDSYPKLQSPFPVRIVDPSYPIDGLISGAVVTQLNLDTAGRVRQARVIQGPPRLTEAAVDALRHWIFYVPPGLDALSRTAVVVVHFKAPIYVLTTEPRPDRPAEKASLVSGDAVGAPIGTEGTLAAETPEGLVFGYGSSHWLVPYPLITRVEYVSSADQTFLIIKFSGLRNDEAVTFRLSSRLALTTVSNLSARTGKPIDFVNLQEITSLS